MLISFSGLNLHLRQSLAFLCPAFPGLFCDNLSFLNISGAPSNLLIPFQGSYNKCFHHHSLSFLFFSCIVFSTLEEIIQYVKWTRDKSWDHKTTGWLRLEGNSGGNVCGHYYFRLKYIHMLCICEHTTAVIVKVKHTYHALGTWLSAITQFFLLAMEKGIIFHHHQPHGFKKKIN